MTTEDEYYNEKISTDNQDQAYRLPVMLGAVLSRDGGQFCYLLGDNLQDGVSGFGKSVSEAAYAFWADYHKDRSNEGEVE